MGTLVRLREIHLKPQRIFSLWLSGRNVSCHGFPVDGFIDYNLRASVPSDVHEADKLTKHSLRGYVPGYILLESPLFAQCMLSPEK